MHLWQKKQPHTFSSGVSFLPLSVLHAQPAVPPPELVSSLSNHGILQPLLVVQYNDCYVVIEGRKRFAAARRLGMQKVPVVLIAATIEQKTELQRWFPDLAEPVVDRKTRSEALLLEARNRGIINKDDLPELRNLDETELVEELKSRWLKKQQGEGAESTVEEEPDEPEKHEESVDAGRGEDETDAESGQSEQDEQDVKNRLRGFVKRDTTLKRCYETLNSFYSRVSSYGKINGVEVERIVQLYLKEKQKNPHGFFAWNGESLLTPLQLHGLLVMKACIHMAQSLKWTRVQTVRLGVAGLLHDIGLVAMDWNPEKHGEEESESGGVIVEPQEHLDLGARLIREASSWGNQIESVCLDHHERWNGSGGPNRKKEYEVDLPVRIISFLDDFMLLVRPFNGNGVTPHEAAAEMGRKTAEGLFDENVYRAFLTFFSAWPIGSVLRLQEGEVVQVVGSDARNPAAPRVKILQQAEGKEKSRFSVLKDPALVTEDLTFSW